MEPRELIDFLEILEKLKCNTRHSRTSNGRLESVAEHSWRLAVMALLLKDEFPELDMERVVYLCLIHDWGEAVTGDIPAFLKNSEDEAVEQKAIMSLLKGLPDQMSHKFQALFDEMEELQTNEAKLTKALDKVEALIQHNEAGPDTWLPLEFELNLTYGDNISKTFAYTERLREEVRKDTKRSISTWQEQRQGGMQQISDEKGG